MITARKFLKFLLVLVFLLPFAMLFSLPGQKLHLIACNVGEGDAILLTKGFTQILIDGGPNNKVIDCLSQNMPFWDRTLELIINTHPDADHLTGLVEVLQRYKVRKFVSNSLWVESQVFKGLRDLVIAEAIPVYSPQKGDKIKLAGLEFEILWPQTKVGDTLVWNKDYTTQHAAASLVVYNSGENVLGEQGRTEKTNEDSIVLHLKYQDFDAILTGDITAKQEAQIIKDYQFKDIEVLKIPHHGSKYSSSEEFLKAIHPQIAIISVGKNSFGHPTQEVLDRLQSIGAKILRTDQNEVNLSM